MSLQFAGRCGIVGASKATTNHTPKMNSKLNRVFRVVVGAVGNQMSRYQAAECAERLLKKHGGNVALAIENAKTPYKIGGQFAY
jgi:hypothetical protein